MSVPSDSEADLSEGEENVQLEVKPKGVGRKKPPPPTVLPEQEGVDKKVKRQLSSLQLEKLANARKKALEVRRANALAKKEATVAETPPEKKEKPKKQPKKQEPLQESEDEEQPPVHVEKPKKKKKPKKPIVIVQQEESESSSSDDQVIYIKQPRNRRRDRYREPRGDGLGKKVSVQDLTPQEPERLPSPPPPPPKSAAEIRADMDYHNLFNSAPSRRRR